MLKTTLATALVATLLITAPASSAYAMGGDGGGFFNAPEATAHNPDGSSITSRGNRDGSRTVTTRDNNGRVVKVEKRGGKKKKAANKPRRRSMPFAINHTDGIASFGIAPGVHVVLSFGH